MNPSPPDQSKISELKDLIIQSTEHGEIGVKNTYRSIAISVEVGKRISELKKALGKEWVTWRDANLPEAVDVEKGSTKLYRLHERQPSLFTDEGQYVKLGRWAGVVPMTQQRKPGPKASASKMIYTWLSRAAGVLVGPLWQAEGDHGREQVRSALRPLVAWMRVNDPDLLKES